VKKYLRVVTEAARAELALLGFDLEAPSQARGAHPKSSVTRDGAHVGYLTFSGSPRTGCEEGANMARQQARRLAMAVCRRHRAAQR